MNNSKLFFYFTFIKIYDFFFFFQAEDGIRDLYVTGVQTCALPILDCRVLQTNLPTYLLQSTLYKCITHKSTPSLNTPFSSVPRLGLSVKCTPSVFIPCRSEERRVGKECRSRWAAYNLKKKNITIEN